MNLAYITDVWNAAYIVTSCGDDSFMDFRGWLIAQGKTIYESVLRNPDNLVNVVTFEDREQCMWESFSYVADQAYQQKTGIEDGIPSPGFHPVLTGVLPLSNPSEAYQEYYPKLWAKFGWIWNISENNDQTK